MNGNKKRPKDESIDVRLLTTSESKYAITIRRAYKHYGCGTRKTNVLLGLNMTIAKGSIYGLLGPSGCGKTTLLQCIVGKQRLHSGRIRVFNGSPGSISSGVPGNRVGYMPQELALYSEFTIRETLIYFGRIFALSRERIQRRTEFLFDFLDLRNEDSKYIGNLSGGQQRRASLAAALLHEPELLILDEPTVGVDPLLRQTIWNHLLDISQKSKTTIVITTHYIEEAKQATCVGMLRRGVLLAENQPSALQRLYSKDNLEDVFLHLCLEVNVSEGNKLNETTSSKLTKNKKMNVENEEKKDDDEKEDDEKDDDEKNNVQSYSSRYDWSFSSFIKPTRLHALVIKNFIRMWRNIGFLIFQFILPTTQVSLFCLAIGRNLLGMSLAVYNEESSFCKAYNNECLLGVKNSFLNIYEDSSVHRQNLSCRYLSYIESTYVNYQFYSNLETAKDAVKSGQHWGLLVFKSNFSSSLYDRIFGILSLELENVNQTLDQSGIHVHLDMTNQQVGYTIMLRLQEAYESFSKNLLSSCGKPESLASLPLVFEEPIYGSNSPTFTEFMAPGVILSITYFMAVGLTALSFIIERKEGLLDRSWVAGVTATEVLLAHLLSQFAVMAVQVGLVLLFMITVFNIPAHGSLTWIVLLTLLQGICGMAFGLLVSSLCDNEQDAIQVALGSFYPNLLLSGIIWPLEGMPSALQTFSFFLPQTYACEAMRGILSRGWGLQWPQVYRGFLVTLAWTLGLLILSAIMLRIRR